MAALQYDVILPLNEKAVLDNINYDKKELNIIYSDNYNEAAFAASGDYICFFYSSAEPCADFFNALDTALTTNSAVMFCTLPHDTAVYYNPATLESPCIDGAFAISRSMFIKLNGFDKRFTGSAALTDLSLRLRVLGQKIYYTKNAKVKCERAFINESFANAQYNRLLLSIKHDSLRGALSQSRNYLSVLKKPPHYPHVRKELAQLYIKAAARLLPLCLYKIKNSADARNLLNDFLFLRRGEYEKAQLKSEPTVTVIVRTCRRPSLLREALLCLRNQTYTNLEIIVCEDNEPYSEKMIFDEFSDLNIHYICEGRHIGRSRNGNNGLKAATGEYCTFLDDDDLIYPEHIEALLYAKEKEPDARLTLGSAAAIYFDTEKEGAREPRGLRPMLFDRIDIFTMCQACRIPIQAALFERTLYTQAGGLHEGLNANEDWAMWLKFLAKSPRSKAAGADVERITSLFAQPANNTQAAQRISEYQKDNEAFFADSSISFNVSLYDMRKFYSDILADIEHLQGRGELDEFIKREKNKYI